MMWEITYSIVPVINKKKVRLNYLTLFRKIGIGSSLPILLLFLWCCLLLRQSKRFHDDEETKKEATSSQVENNKSTPSETANTNNDEPPSEEQSSPNQNSETKQTDSGRIIRCPRCGSKMVKRHGKYGYFYGCSRYPYCKGTRSIK